jgi:hypothetical protein
VRFATEIGPMTRAFVMALLDEAGVDTTGLSLRIVKRATTANYGGTCLGTVARVPHPKNFGFDWSLFGQSVLHEVQHAVDNRSGEVNHLGREAWEKRARQAQRVVAYERMRELAIQCRAPHAEQMPEHDEVAALLAREVQKHRKAKAGGKRRHSAAAVPANALVLVPLRDGRGKPPRFVYNRTGYGWAKRYTSEDGRYVVVINRNSSYNRLRRKTNVYTIWEVYDNVMEKNLLDPISKRAKTRAEMLTRLSEYLGRPVVIVRS